MDPHGPGITPDDVIRYSVPFMDTGAVRTRTSSHLAQPELKYAHKTSLWAIGHAPRATGGDNLLY